MALPAILGGALARFVPRLSGIPNILRSAAGGLAGGGAFAAAGPLVGRILGGGIGSQPRRRRRRALTADDMRTALTIASAISKKAAENFILQRTRR